VANEHKLPAIVYATRRGDVEDLAAFLKQSGVNARAYHAGMPVDARAAVQDDFVSHHCDVICATIAFGMGVDMPDVRSVIHYHPPKSPEGWIQESGRAGRDGLPSHCELLLNGGDQSILRGMVEAKQPGPEAVRAILQNIFSQGARAIISRYHLSTLNDVPMELLDILFARLEAVPLRWDAAAKRRLLDGFPKRQQEVFAEMLASRQRTNLLDLAEGSVIKMNKIVSQLRELEAGEEVKLKMSHSLLHFRVKKEPENVHALADDILAVFREHSESDLKRIDKVFEIALSRRCIAASLVSYFGEKLAVPCGHCSSCLGQREADLVAEPIAEVTLDELSLIQGLVAEKRPAISSPERMARFLCGVYSPAMMRYRLYKHDLWGLLDRLPYDDVLAYTRAQLG